MPIQTSIHNHWQFLCFHLQSHFCQTDQLLYSYIWMSHPFDFSCSYNKHLDEWISFSITIWDRNTLYCCQWTEEIFEEHLKVLLPKSHSLANRKSVKLKELAGETFIMLSELGFWSNAVKHAIPDAKFIEQDDITDLRDIIAHSTLPAFATDYTEQADHLPALKKQAM